METERLALLDAVVRLHSDHSELMRENLRLQQHAMMLHSRLSQEIAMQGISSDEQDCLAITDTCDASQTRGSRSLLSQELTEHGRQRDAVISSALSPLPFDVGAPDCPWLR
jgi:hypothetical protein